MSIQPSPEVNAMIFILTGERLIDADEDLAYESRRPYSGLGRKLDRMSSLIDKSIHDIAEVMPDDLSKSYARAMGMLIDDGGKNYLREFAEQLDKIAEGRRKTSMDIMESKWQVIAEVIRLLIEIAIYLAMSFFTGGATASQIMMAKLRSRFMILTTLTHLLQRLHIAPSLTEAFAEAFTTFAVRLAMMNFAPDGRRPDRFDWNDILKSAAFGAAAGGLTSIFDDFARNIVKSYDNNFLKTGPDLDFKYNPNPRTIPDPDLRTDGPGPGPNPQDRPDPGPHGNGPTPGTNPPVTFRNDPLSFRNNPDLWRNNQLLRHNADRPGALAGHYGLKGTSDFLAAGAGEALAEILIKGAFDGDWSTSWSTFVGAGLSSQVEATLTGIAQNSGAELRHMIDKLRNQPPPTVSGGSGDGTDRPRSSDAKDTDGAAHPDTTGGAGSAPLLSPPLGAQGTGPGDGTLSQSPPPYAAGNPPPYTTPAPPPYSPGTLPVTAAENQLWQQVHQGPAEVREQALRDLAALRGAQPPGSHEIGVRDALHGDLSRRPEVRVAPVGDSPGAETDTDAVRRALDGFGTPVTVDAPVTMDATAAAPRSSGHGPAPATSSPVAGARPDTDDGTGTTPEQRGVAFDVADATDMTDVSDAVDPSSRNTPGVVADVGGHTAVATGDGDSGSVTSDGPGASATPGTGTGVRTGGAPAPTPGSPQATTSPGPSPQHTAGRGTTATPDSGQTPADDVTRTTESPRTTTGDVTGTAEPSRTTTSPQPRSAVPVADSSGTAAPSDTDDDFLSPDPETTTADPPKVPTTGSYPSTGSGGPDTRSDAEAGTARTLPLTVLVSPTRPPVDGSPEATGLLDGAGTDHAVVLGPAVTPDSQARPVRTAVELTREGPGAPVRVRPLISAPDGIADTGFPGSDVLLPLADALGTGPAPRTLPATESTATSTTTSTATSVADIADFSAPLGKVLTETAGPVHGAGPAPSYAPEAAGTPHDEEAFGLSTLTGAETAVGTRANPAPVRQDGTVVPETEGTTTAPPRRRILVVCDESGLGLGGVPVFNMELVKGLHHDHDVTLLTVDDHADYDPENMREQHGGAKIVNVSVPGVGEGRDRLGVLAKGSPDQYGLPGESDAFDIVIGHSRFSGPAAQEIRDSWYPGARVVHFLHTSPVRLDRIKQQPEKGAAKATIERRLMQNADLVAGVGPLLAQEAERLSEEVLRIPALHGFVPGTEIGTPVEPSVINKAKYLLHLPRKLKLLLPGRATDEIKGVEAAVQAVGMLRRPRARGGYGLDVRLTIRGGPHPEKNPEEHARWTSIIQAHGEGGVTMLPFSTNPADLVNDREATHALIMPSLHEGFGLVATEAAGRSIPVLVNGESGAAEFLKTVTEHGAGMTVDAPFTVDSDTGTEIEGGADARAQAWAAAIAALHGKLPEARGEARQLYRTLTGFTWRHAAQALVEAAMATAAPVPDRAHPERYPHRGAVTQQGPHGSVEKLKDRSDWQPHDFWDGSTPKPTTGLWSEAEQLARLSELAGVLDLSGVPASSSPPAGPGRPRSQSALGPAPEATPHPSGSAPAPSRSAEPATDLRLESGGRDGVDAGDHVPGPGPGPGVELGSARSLGRHAGDGLEDIDPAPEPPAPTGGHDGAQGLKDVGEHSRGDGGTPQPAPATGPDDSAAVPTATPPPSPGRIIVRPPDGGTADADSGPRRPADEPAVTTLDGHTVPVAQLRRWVPDTAVTPEPGRAVRTLTISQGPAEDGTAHSAGRRALLGQDTFRGVRTISTASATPPDSPARIPDSPAGIPGSPEGTPGSPASTPGSPASTPGSPAGTEAPVVRRTVFTGPPAPLPGSGTEHGADFFVSHGTPRIVVLGTNDPARPTVKVSGVQLGEVLKSWAGDGDQDRPLVLFSCETGRQPEVAGLPVAQHVANRTGRPVYAPTSEVGTARDRQGEVRAVLTEGPDGPGRWRLFTPEPGGADLDELARVAGLHAGPEPADAFARARTLQQIRTLRDALGPDAEQRPENHELLAGLAFVDGLRWLSPDTAARYGDGRMTPDLLRRMVLDRPGAANGTGSDPAAAGPTAEQYTEFLRAAAELRATAGPGTTLDALLPPPPPALPPNTLVSPEDVRGLSYAPSAQITWSLSTTPLPLSELALSPEDTAELARRRPDLVPATSRPATLAEDMTLLSKDPAAPGPADLVDADGTAFRRLDTPGGGDCLFRSLLDSARSLDVPPAWAARNVTGLRTLLRDRLAGSELLAAATEATPDPVLAVVDDLRVRALAGESDPDRQRRLNRRWNRIARAVVTGGDADQWRRILRDSAYPHLARVAPTPADARRLGTGGLVTAAAEQPGLWASPFGDLLPQALAHTLDLDLRLVQPDPHAQGSTFVVPLHPGGQGGTLHLAYNGRDHFDALVPASAPITAVPDTAPTSDETGTAAPPSPQGPETKPSTGTPSTESTPTPDTPTPSKESTPTPPEEGTPTPDGSVQDGSGSDPFGDWLRSMGGITDLDGPGTEAPDKGDPVPLETQLDRYRPARLLTGEDAPPPGPAPRTVTFEDGSRLPAVLISPDADPSGGDPGTRTDGTRRTPPSGLFTGPGVLTLRSPEDVARQILGELPKRLRDQFDEAELLRLLTTQPGAFTAPRGARLVGREKSGVGHEMTIEAIPYHRWERFSDVDGSTVRVDTMRRGQAGTGGGRSVGFGRRIAAGISMGPPLSWLVKIGVSLGWTRRTDYSQGTQAYNQSEYRAVDGSHLHLDDVHYRVRVERVTEAPAAGGRDTASGPPAQGPHWQRSEVHTARFAVRDGLSWRLPDDLTVPFEGPRRAPKTLTFPDGQQPRATDITGLHFTDPPEDLAIAVSGARPGSSAHRTIVSYVRPGRLLALFGRLAGPVSGPELTRGSGQHPLGHLIVERSIPHRATLVTESVKAEIRDLTQTTYQNERGHVRDTRFGIQVTSGPNHTFIGPETDVRLQGGPLVRADFSSGRGHYLGTDAARKTTGRVRNHPVALYRVERTLMVRKAGEPPSAARPVRVVSLDWMSTQDARRLAGWDSRTPGQAGPDPDARPPVPWYLTREDPVHLSGQVRAEGFRPDRPQPPAPGQEQIQEQIQDQSQDQNQSQIQDQSQSQGQDQSQSQNQPQTGQPPAPQDPLRVFTDTVLDTLHRSYPSMFVPPLMLRHQRLARFWYGDGRMRTALHNDRQVREALNRPSLAQSLDDLTTTGVPVTLTEDGKVTRGHHTLILRARLTDRRFESTMSERSLRNAVIGTEVSGQGQQASSTLSGGAELGISPRDHDKVPEAGLPRQTGNVSLGARYSHTEQKATRNTVAVTHDHLTFQNGAHLYSYRVELSASFEGHRRPRGWARLLSVGLLGAGVFVSKAEERPLFSEGTETVGRVELAVPAAHGSERHAPVEPPAAAPPTTPAAPAPAPWPQRVSATEADQLLDGTRPLPRREPADRGLVRRLLSAPHVVLSVEGGPQRQQLVQDTADRAAGGTWHVSAPGAPVRTALRRAMANLSVAGQLGQYLGPFGSRVTGLNGAGPFRTHYLKAAVRGELHNLRVKSDPKPASLEATIGNEHRVVGTEGTLSHTTLGLQGADMPLQQAPGQQAVVGSYATALQYAWGKGRSLSQTLTRGRNTTLTFAGRMYLVVADATETVAVRDRWTGAMGMAGTRAAARISSAAGHLSGRLARGLAPRRAAAALQHLRDAVMFHLPMQDVIEAGLAPDGLGTTTPDNLGRGYRIPGFLRGRRFPGHPSGQLDASHAAQRLMGQLERIGVPSHDREQVLQRLSPDFLRANLHELTTDGMTLPVRYRTWHHPTHLPAGGSPAQLRFKLTPVTTTVERLRTGFELEDYRTTARDDADGSSQDRGADVTLSAGQRATESGVLIAAPSLQGTAAKKRGTTRTETAGRTSMPNIATVQAHAEIVTGYTLTVTMTDAAGDPLRPRAVAAVGSLREIVPANLLTPDGDGADGAITEQDVPRPERAVRLLTADQARPEGIAAWRASSTTPGDPSGSTGTSDILPFDDDRIGSGILAVDIHGAANVQDALTLATARADGFGDSDLGRRHSGDALAARVRMARHTPLTALGTAPAQAQQEATTQAGLTAGFREALSANGSPLPAQASARLVGQFHTADSRLYAKMHRRGARLLAVENKPRMEAMQRAKTSDALESGITDNVEGAVGSAPLAGNSNAGLTNPGATVPIGGANDGTALKGAADTTLGTHIKVVTNRSMLFALPVSWLSVAEVDHRLTDSRPLRALGKARRGPRAAEAETTALVWLREDVARDYGLLDDTTFPDEVGSAWDDLAKAAGDLATAEQRYYDARARARETWLDLAPEEQAALGDGDPDRPTALPRALAESPAVTAWQAARDEVRRWRERTDAAAADHHRLHLAASRLTAHHQGLPSVPVPDRPQEYTEPGWRSEAPAPYTITDATDSAPRTLTSPDGATVREVHDVPHDGASFFHALLATAAARARLPHLLGTGLADRFTAAPGDPAVTAEAVGAARDRLAWALGEDGNEDLLDGLALDVSDTFTQDELDSAGVQFTPAQQAEFDAFGRLPVTFWPTPEQRIALATTALSRPFAPEPRQDGDEGPDDDPAPQPARRAGDHGGADLLPALAARVLGTPLTVVTGEGREQLFLPHGTDPAAVDPAGDPVLFAADGFFHAALPPGSPAPVTTALPKPPTEATSDADTPATARPATDGSGAPRQPQAHRSHATPPWRPPADSTGPRYRLDRTGVLTAPDGATYTQGAPTGRGNGFFGALSTALNHAADQPGLDRRDAARLRMRARWSPLQLMRLHGLPGDPAERDALFAPPPPAQRRGMPAPGPEALEAHVRRHLTQAPWGPDADRAVAAWAAAATFTTVTLIEENGTAHTYPGPAGADGPHLRLRRRGGDIVPLILRTPAPEPSRPESVDTPVVEEEAHELSTLTGADETPAAPANPAPVLRPFKLGSYEFTNLNQTDAYVDKAVRIIELLDEHSMISDYVGGRPVRITLHLRTTETPADVRDLGPEGVQINLASYYFEKYDTGYVMGMLAHEIGLHPLASRNADIAEQEEAYRGMPLPVPGLTDLKQPRTMNTESAGQADHIMAAYPATIRHGVYRDIVVEMARVLARRARVGVPGAKNKDVTDLFDTYLMDLASIAVTSDYRMNAVKEPNYTARVYNAYKELLRARLADTPALQALLPPDKGLFGVARDFTQLATSIAANNRGDSIQQPAPPADEARPRLPGTGTGTSTRPQPLAPPARGARDSRPRFVVRSGFDARRFSHQGDPVTDLTVRVALRGTDAQATHVFDQLASGVEEFLNAPGHRLPNGDRLHVTVEYVDPAASPHLTVDLTGRDRAMDQTTWWTDAAPVQLVHELTHQLGLRDEYRDADSPHRPHVLGSLLGDLDADPEDSSLSRGGLRDRHLALLGALIGDVDARPAERHDEQDWETARAAAEPVTRRAVWVDPVSLPRPADDTVATDVPAHMPQDVTFVPFTSGNFEFTNLKHTDARYRDKAIRIIELLGEHATIKDYLGDRPVRITLRLRTTETPADVTDRGDDGVDINLASYYFEKYDTGYLMGMLAHEIGLHPFASRNGNIAEEEELFAGMPLAVPGLESLSTPRFMNTEGAGQADHVMAAFPHTIRHGLYRDIVVEMAGVLAQRARVGVEGAKYRDVTDLFDTYLMDLASIAVTNDHRARAITDPSYTARAYNAYKAQLAEHLPQDSPLRALLPGDKGRFGVLGDFAQLAASVGTNNRGDSIQVPIPTGEALPRLPQAGGEQTGSRSADDTAVAEAAPVLRPFKLGSYEFTNLNQTDAYVDKAVRIIELLDEHSMISDYVGGRPVRITLHLRTTETPADVRDLGPEGVQINLASYYFEKYDTGYVMGMLAHEIGLHPLASRNADIAEQEEAYRGMPLPVPGLTDLKQPRVMDTESAGQADHVMAAYPATIRHGVYRDIVVEMARVLAQRARVGATGVKYRDVTDLFDTYLMDLASIAVTNDHRARAITDPSYTARAYNAYKAQLAEHLPQDSPLRALLPGDKGRFGVLGDFAQLAASVGTNNRGDSIQRPAPAAEARPRLPQGDTEGGGSPARAPQVNGPRDSRPRFVVRSGFDARRFTHDGEPVTDLTVRVALRGTRADAAGVFDRLGSGVRDLLNGPGYRLPNGDRLHVTVEQVDPADAPHLTVDLVGRDRGMDQRTWWVDAAPAQLVHELTHQLGLRDEYRDADAPHRPHVLGSLLGDLDADPDDSSLAPAGLRDRHLALLGALIGDVDPHPVDGDGGQETWEAARAAAEPVTRRAVWVDPVSLPRPADGTVATDVPAHMPQDVTFVPFKSGNFEFTNLKHTDARYRDKAIRIIELLGEHPMISDYVGDRPVRITLRLRTTETPADVTDRGADGVDINLASYYFEKYDIGYVMGMLAHEIGLHPLASRDRNIPDEEAMFEHFPLSVPGLEDQNPPRTMSTEGAGQADHIMAAYPSSTRHRIYRDIVLQMADMLARAAQAGAEGAAGQDVTDLIDTYLMDLASIALTNDHRTNAAKEPRNTAKVYNAYKAQLLQHMAPDSPARVFVPADKGLFGVVRDFAQLAAAVAANNRGDSIQVPIPAGEAMPRLPQAGDPAPGQVLQSLRLGQFEFTNLNQTEAYVEKAVRIVELLDEHATIKDYLGDRPVRITLRLRTTETPADVTDRGDDGVDINLASYYFEKYDTGYLMGMLAHEIGLHPFASRNGNIAEEEELFAGMPLAVPGLESLSTPRFMNTEGAGQADHVMAAFPHTIRHGLYRDIVVEMAGVLAQRARVGVEGAKYRDVTDLFDTYLMDLASIAVTNDHRARAITDPSYTARAYNAYKAQLAEHLPQDSPLRALLPGDKGRFGVLGDFAQLAASVGTNNRGDSIQRPAPPAEAPPRLPQAGGPHGGPSGTPQVNGPRDSRPRFVVRSGFDARRFTHDGEPVTDLTVRVAMRGADGQSARVFGQLSAGVEEYLNHRGYRLPSGDRLHVTVEPVDADDSPHLTVDLVGRDRGMDQRTWWVDASPAQLVHELTHQLGLRDEYRDADSPHRPHVLGSLLGDLDADPEDSSLAPAGLRDRHLALLGALIGDVDPHSGRQEDQSWEAARGAAEPVTRRSVWVDPVSLPRAADDTAVAGDVPPRVLTPFRSGNFEFTNLNHTDEGYRDRAVRIIDLLRRHETIRAYIDNRPCRITLHVRTTEPPADVVDRGPDGVDINLASYYFEKYGIGHVMGMLAHEIGLHPLASQNAGLPDEEAMFEDFPLPVPGLEDVNPPRTMNTTGAGQADHIMAAYQSSTRHRIYRDIVLGMARVLAQDARNGEDGAKPQDVTDLFDCYLMDLASIAVTNDHRVNAAMEPGYTARVFNAYKRTLHDLLAADPGIQALLPSDKSRFGVMNDFRRIGTFVSLNNRGPSIQREETS